MRYFLILILMSDCCFAAITLNKNGVVVNEKEREDTILVTNNSSEDIIIYSKLITLEDKPESRFFVSPEIAKIVPNGKQIIRIILNEKEMKSQILSRLKILEIHNSSGKPNHVQASQAYNIPVLGNPRTLIANNKPWELLDINFNSLGLEIKNESRYLVKLMPYITCYKNNEQEKISTNKVYLFHTDIIRIKDNNCTKIAITPIGNYGEIKDEVFIENEHSTLNSNGV